MDYFQITYFRHTPGHARLAAARARRHSSSVYFLRQLTPPHYDDIFADTPPAFAIDAAITPLIRFRISPLYYFRHCLSIRFRY
jgi:hypothetical protein